MTDPIPVVGSRSEWLTLRSDLKRRGLTIGFVPTMGALHEGHLSLARRSGSETDRTIVSIFVNPTQFDDPTDLQSYPRDMEADERAVAEVGADYLFVPDPRDVYPDEYRFRVTETDTSRILEGAHRPGHFDGVLTVVMRLFQMVRPDVAFFGEKDYQQLLLVKEMCRAFSLEIEVVGCPTVREPDGLAMSSRNVRLGEGGRVLAAEWARLLREGPDAATVRRSLEERGIDVEYVEERWGRRLGAVRIDGIRLIDNVAAGVA
jgi:pantoate--beta-alanine ligase